MTANKNIPLKDFRKFLRTVGCELIRSKGGHEVWNKKGLPRPVILQSHIDPVPLFIIKNNLRTLGMSLDDYFQVIKGLSK